MGLGVTSVRFAPRSPFSKDLDAAVDSYFADRGDGNGRARDRRDVPAMYRKSAIILTWFVASWLVLVFVADRWWTGILASISIGLSIAAIGMSIQHDANHGAYSKHRWINRVLGCTLDVMGVSSFIWRPKHNIGHHTFTNVEAVDYDLDFGALAALSPRSAKRRVHRYQHLYLWFFYGLLLPKWVFYDDWQILQRQRIGVYRLPPMPRSGFVWFGLVKLFFLGWAVIIPALFHPLWQVLLFHFLAAFTLGTTLGTIFQLAHCNSDAHFPVPSHDATKPFPHDFATHQLMTTADFAPQSRLLTWFCGGLNFQVEHHLFAKICHLHYPALAPIVAEVAARHGLRHHVRPTFRSALRSHYLHLRAMGEPTPI